MERLLTNAGNADDVTPHRIAVPTSTKKRAGQRNREMRQRKKGHHRFGMNARIAVWADSGRLRTVHGTADNVSAVVRVGPVACLRWRYSRCQIADGARAIAGGAGRHDCVWRQRKSS